MVGCGDVGQRLVRDQHLNGGGPRWLALTSQREKRDALRALGASPLVGNLDDARTLRRLAGLAHRIVHLAPPPGDGEYDPRTRNLLRSLIRFSHDHKQAKSSLPGWRIGAIKVTPKVLVMIELVTNGWSCMQTDDVDTLMRCKLYILLRMDAHP